MADAETLTAPGITPGITSLFMDLLHCMNVDLGIGFTEIVTLDPSLCILQFNA